MTLSLEHISAGYGKMTIVKDVSLTVAPGEMVALIGPNGAGKSTLLKSIAGVGSITSGRLQLQGVDMLKLTAANRAHAGVVLMPQEGNIFRPLTVMENLQVSAWGQQDIAERREEVLELLPSLKQYISKRAGSLSGGQRQMVALGTALMARPRMLLVDEPTAEVAPNLVGQMLDVLDELAETAGVGLLIVEQNARAALQRADRAMVLVDGTTVRYGPATELSDEPDFEALFFGGDA